MPIKRLELICTEVRHMRGESGMKEKTEKKSESDKHGGDERTRKDEILDFSYC